MKEYDMRYMAKLLNEARENKEKSAKQLEYINKGNAPVPILPLPPTIEEPITGKADRDITYLFR